MTVELLAVAELAEIHQVPLGQPEVMRCSHDTMLPHFGNLLVGQWVIAWRAAWVELTKINLPIPGSFLGHDAGLVVPESAVSASVPTQV